MVQGFAHRSLALSITMFMVATACGAGPLQNDKLAPINVTSRRPADDAAVERQLDQIASIRFDDTPLLRLIPYLSTYKIDAILDLKALEEAGIAADTPEEAGLDIATSEKAGLDIDTPLSLAVSQISLRSILRTLLSSRDMTYVVRDGKLIVTTAEKASNDLIVKVYPVDDLLPSRTDGEVNQTRRAYDSLINVLTSSVYHTTWSELGGPGSIEPFQGTMVVSQSDKVHEQIQLTLTALRESRDRQKQEITQEPIWVEDPHQLDFLHNLNEMSKQRVNFRFQNTPLFDAVSVIAKRFGIQVAWDFKSLRESGVDLIGPITIDLPHVSPQDALRLILQPLDLTFIVKNELILITTADAAANELLVAVYPVADLVTVDRPFGADPAQGDYDSLINLITSTIRPTTWDEVGGPGNISPFPNASSIVFAQTREVHQEISRLLEGLRRVRKPSKRFATRGIDTSSSNSADVLTKAYSIPSGVDAEALVDEVRRLDWQSWNKSGNSLRINGSHLFVRNTRELHRRIDKLLRGEAVYPTGGIGGIGSRMHDMQITDQ